MLITIQEFTLPCENLADGAYTLRSWYPQGYLDSSGQAVASGTATTGMQLRSDVNVSGGFMTFDPYTVYSTLDAQVPNPQSLQIQCQVFRGNSALPIHPFQQSGTPNSWIVPDDLGATISFEEWTIANQRIVLANPPQTFYTAAEVDALIAAGVIQAALNQDYIIGSYASFAAAITAVTVTGGTLVINEATTSTVASQSVPANITLRFTRKGSITVSTGTTLTIAGDIDADPDAQIFFNANSLASEGEVLITSTVNPIYAAWFGDAVNDLGPSLSTAIHSVAAVGGEIKLPRSAIDLLTTVDGTGVHAERLKITGYGRGSTITAKTSGLPAMDFTGTQFLELEDIYMSGDATLTPNVGLLFARISPGASNSAGINHLYNLEISGYWTIAPLYNYGSEEFRAYDCHFENFKDGAVYAGVFTADNDMGVTSPYKTISTGAVSMIDVAVFGCAWECFDTTWIAECLYLRGVVGFASYSSFFAIDRCKTYVHLDSEISCVNVDFTDTRLDAPGVVGIVPDQRARLATYGFLQTGELSSAYITLNQTFDQGVLDPRSGGVFTAVSIAVNCEITTTSAHQLSNGQEVVITGVAGTLGAAINGPRTVTRVSEFKYTIGVDTSGLSGSFAAGYGGGRNFYAESPTAAHPGGSQTLALQISQYNAGFGAVRPYFFLYSGDNSQIDTGPIGAIESVTNTGLGSPSIARSSLQVPIANLILGRPDLCLKNNIFDYSSGGVLVGTRVLAKTAAYTVGGQDVDTLFTNTGAGGSVTFTLPTPTVGMTYEFYRDANQNVIIDVDGSVVIRVGAAASTAGGSVSLDAVGSRLRITAITTTLWIGDLTGTLTFS